MEGPERLLVHPCGKLIKGRDANGADIHGYIDMAAPNLGVLWIRERNTGERIMLSLADVCTAPPGA